jgi:shikimate 5-dehydrogenase
MFAARNIALHGELLKEAEEKVAIDPGLLNVLVGAGGLAAGIVPTYLLTKAHDEAIRKRTRDRAFGAGLATGVATPKLLRGIMNIAQRRGLIAPEEQTA